MDVAELTTEKGLIRIADKALASLVQEACLRVDGVAAMDTGFGSSLSSMIGIEDAEGVHISIRKNTVNTALYILVRHGIRVPELALRVQEKVKETLTDIAGVSVASVDIYIQGILFDKKGVSHGRC